jgi:hypothetical protein
MLAAVYLTGAAVFSGDYYDSRFIWISPPSSQYRILTAPIR